MLDCSHKRAKNTP